MPSALTSRNPFFDSVNATSSPVASSSKSPDASNPFRRAGLDKPSPPPLPPRRTSLGKGRPASASSGSSRNSSTRLHPTSTAAPSLLMQQSLSAAAAGAGASQLQHRPSTPTVHVIRRSSAPVSTKPYRRKSSVRIPGRFLAHVKAHVASDPGARLWSCVDILSPTRSSPYAMIILNQPITRPDIFFRVWRSCTFRICADGGANRLYDLLDPEHRSSFLPNAIKGDLDSLRSEVRTYYASKSVPIKEDGDQNSTDLMKCIAEVEALEHISGKTLPLILLGGLSGRIDQTVHSMALLHRLRSTRPEVFILSGESLAWVLDKGSHLIDIDHTTMGQTCGILPVGVDSATVTTDGLRWNLDGETSFDGLVSTSNHLVPSEPVVKVSTSRPVLWCMEIRDPLPPLSPSHSRLTESSRTADELSRSIRELGLGMARAADGFGKELERMKGGHGPRRSSIRGGVTERRNLVASSGDENDDGSSDLDGKAEVGWQRLD